MTDSIDWQQLRERAPFSPEAFRFVREGLNHTLERMTGAAGGDVTAALPQEEGLAVDLGSLSEADAYTRHVSGQELCLGLRSYAVERYGLLARTVLRGWGVRSTEDFGKIVYAMVDAGLMRTSEQDSLDDFRGVYDFDEAFEGPVARSDRHNAGAGEVG
ncbi:MAG: hypothetical protein KIT54_11370 [Phycisphaeraceae bacterium]|nr:hypothetical protein [Phycisphaeraceae bacterium]